MSLRLPSDPTEKSIKSARCFVVMPFGVKPMRDGSERTYDFDKVYRVIRASA